VEVILKQFLIYGDVVLETAGIYEAAGKELSGENRRRRFCFS
jgi:hypothetical protein